MEPCIQGGKIGVLEATVEGIEKALDRLADGQERFIVVLERVAGQGADIEALKQGQSILFTRVREIELKQENQNVKLAGIIAGVSLFVSAVTVWIGKHL